jgi:hypothetical protein
MSTHHTSRLTGFVIVCGAAFLAACASSASTSSPDPMTTTNTQPAGDAGAAADGAGRGPVAPAEAGADRDAGASPEGGSDPCAGASGLVIDGALALSTTSPRLGDTLTGAVTYRNCASAPVSVQDIVITSRPPNATHAGGPYDDFAPSRGAVTVPAGGSVIVSASRTLVTTDPGGNWIGYATYEDETGTWHDGPDVAFTVTTATGGGDGGTVVGSNPQNPMNGYTPDQTFTLNSGQSDYYVSVPSSYDPSHETPMTLFVWLHGCGGQGLYDASMVSPGQSGQPQDWISLALGGREGTCWQPMSDVPWVLAAISDIETRFNVDLKRVILGGYSSGGDLGYPTVFLNAGLFAGILVENSDPFDNGYDPTTLLAAASWKVNVVHLAHLQDTTYPIATVQSELATVKSAGFPVTVIERVGTHWDDPGAMVAGQTVAGTAADLQTVLLPYIDSGWSAP